MAMHLGLDNRFLLPPFMPVLRNEDGVWNLIRTICFPSSFSGHLPSILQHLPPEEREAPTLEDVVNFRGLRINDLMCQFIYFIAGNNGSIPDMVNLGAQFSQWATLSPAQFSELVEHIARQTQERIISQTLNLLDQASTSSTTWLESVTAYVNSSRRALNQPNFYIPIDLPSAHDRMVLLQKLTVCYGELLQYWPAMWEHARSRLHDLLTA